MKPSLFIGSSSESLPVAEAVHDSLRSVADVSVWSEGVFGVSEIVIDRLIVESRYHDYAVLVLAPEDVLHVRDQEHSVARDNVIFELGLFTSVLGRGRCFFMVPSGTDDFRLPTDLAGVTYAPYDITGHNGDINRAMASASLPIKNAIRNPDPLSGTWLFYREASRHDEPNGSMQLLCAAGRATARILLTKDNDGKPIDRRFRYEGRYTAGQIVLNFEQSGAEDQIVGCMVLRASANRSHFEGVSVFWHHDRAEMMCSPFRLERKQD